MMNKEFFDYEFSEELIQSIKENNNHLILIKIDWVPNIDFFTPPYVILEFRYINNNIITFSTLKVDLKKYNISSNDINKLLRQLASDYYNTTGDRLYIQEYYSDSNNINKHDFVMFSPENVSDIYIERLHSNSEHTVVVAKIIHKTKSLEHQTLRFSNKTFLSFLKNPKFESQCLEFLKKSVNTLKLEITQSEMALKNLTENIDENIRLLLEV